MRKKGLRNVFTKAMAIALSAMLLLPPVVPVQADSPETKTVRTGTVETYDSIDGLSGDILYDTDGNRVYTCGGEVHQIEENGETKYYWFGVDDLNPGPGFQNNHPGIHLYSSSDLYNWKYEGVMYNEENDIYAHPKMLYNGTEYVMWVSVSKRSDDGMTGTGTVKVVSSPSITGPFTLVNEKESGGFINLYEAAPGTAYLICDDYTSGSSRVSKTKLSSDYKTTEGEKQLLNFSSGSLTNTEGGIFKQNGKYYIVNAGMTEYASADSLDGTWTRHDLQMWDGTNKKDISSKNQTSDVFRVRTGNSDLWVCVGDSVNGGGEPRYIWLPIKFFGDGTIALWELSNWKLGDIEGEKPEGPEEPGESGNYENISGLSGRVLYDTDGRKIYACGGEVHEVEQNGQKKWYWFGVDDLNSEKPNEHPGIHLYSSSDLYNWKYEGAMYNEENDIYAHPKMLYNGKEYVMWVWTNSKNSMGMPEGTGTVKVLSSPSITEPFTLVEEKEGLNGFFNLYETERGTAYLIDCDYSGGITKTKLSSDYKTTEG